MRVHILGTGAIGCQVAVGLRARNNVTLILRSQQALQDFRSRQNVITYKRVDQKEPFRASGFDAVVPGENAFSENPLQAVVVATKSQHAVNAIESIRPLLSSSSTIVLLQNGMGVADELLRTFWSGDAKADAPSIIVGVNRHAVHREKPFDILHASGWTDPEEGIHLSAMPGSLPKQTQPVIQAFTDSAELNATDVDWPELQTRMMRKLVVNGSINAVAAMLECSNGSLIENKHGLILLRGVCDEAAQVLTELNATSDELFKIVYNTLVISGDYFCSSVQDITSKRITEVDYINGYICRLAEERKVDVPTNRLLVSLLHAKEHYISAK